MVWDMVMRNFLFGSYECAHSLASSVAFVQMHLASVACILGSQYGKSAAFDSFSVGRVDLFSLIVAFLKTDTGRLSLFAHASGSKETAV